jgi:biotin carboxyl carrier protein
MSRSPIAAILAAALLGLSAGHAGAHGDEDHSQDDKKPALMANSTKPASIMNTETVAARRLPDGSLFVPKAVQRQIGLRHRIAAIREMAATVEFNGKVIADPNAGGRVQADQPGRVESGSGGLPILGQKVSKGQVLASLRPTASSLERGNQRAQFAEIEAQLAIAENRLARYAQLEGAIPQKEIETARIEVDALQKRRAAVGSSVGSRETLRAPVSGVISAANVVPGQVVEAGAILFEVIDPTRLAVEALAYDPSLVAGIAGASAILPGGTLELQFLGGGRVLREQALPLLFRIKSRGAGWMAPVAVGQPLKVIAQTSRTHTGALLPRAALVKTGAGETAVWVRDGVERFALRRVSVESHDAMTVAAITGIREGERVVTDAASLLSQVR